MLGSVFFEYQPVFRLPDRRPVGLEAFVRHAAGVSPPVLVAEARRRGALPAWEAKLFDTALKEVAPPSKGVFFFNVTCESFRHEVFRRAALEKLRAAAVPPGVMVLEVSVRDLRRDGCGFFDALLQWRSEGVLTAVDDFGGERDLDLVVGQPRPDYVKVDAAAIMNISKNRLKQRGLARLLDSIGSLGMAAVIEGVEQTEDLLWIENQGWSVFAQGYALARPVAIENLVFKGGLM